MSVDNRGAPGFKLTRFSSNNLVQRAPEPKVKVLIPMYEPLEVSKCEKCGRVIAEPKELIRIHGSFYLRV